MADGKVTISTALDNSGLEKDSKKVESSAKKTAMKLAAEYRKAGMSQSEALRKAWSEIERTTQKSSKKSGDAIRKNMGGATDSVVGSLGGLKSVVGKLAGAVAAAFAVQKVVQFGAACIELGSNVAEVQNVVDTAFGDMAWKMEQFADSSITSYGMSELAAKKTGSTYMAMARGMGIAEDAASDMAIALTGLTGDVASFYNITQEEADTKLKSVFTGETETLKELGVVMTQANLQQYALAHGMNANITAMSQAEQVALRYAFVTDALNLAAGDFVKTQNSWANQTRILVMQWQQFMAVIGQALTTVLLPVVKMLNSIVSGLISVANAFNAAVTAIFGGPQTQLAGIADANAAVASGAQDAAAGEEALADSTKAAGKAAKGALASFDQLNVLQQSSGGSSSGSAVGGAAGMTFAPVTSEDAASVPPALEKIKAFMEQLKTLFAPSIESWAGAWDTLRAKAAQVWPEIKNGALGLWREGLLPLGEYLMSTFVPDVVNAFSEAFAPIVGDVLAGYMQIFSDGFVWRCEIITAAITGVVLPALEVLRDVWMDAMGSITAVWAQYGQPLVDGFVQLFNNIREVVTSVWQTVIIPFLAYCIVKFQELWSNSLSPLWQNLLGMFADIGMYMLTGWNEILLPFITWIVGTFGPFFTAAFQAAADKVVFFAGMIAGMMNVTITAIRGVLQFLTAVFQGEWGEAWQIAKDTVTAVWDGILKFIENTVNGIISLVNGMINAVVEGVNSVIRMINSLSFDIPAWVPVFGGESWSLNIPTFSAPQIPYLAQGAVLPPNKPFLAMVGDQTSGTNVEAPLETIKQAVAEVLGEGGWEIVIKFAASGGLAELVRLLKPYIDRESTRVGAKLISGGVY